MNKPRTNLQAELQREALFIDVTLVCIRLYAAYPLSYRHREEIIDERGLAVEHSSIKRWAICFLPLVEEMARKHKRPVGARWRTGPF